MAPQLRRTPLGSTMESANSVQLAWFRFPDDLSIILGSARIHVPDVAARCGAIVETRQDPELGHVYGFALRLPSGRVVVIEEWEYEIQEFHAEGPYISASTDLVASGAADAVFGEAVQALQLAQSEIGWTPETSGSLEQVRWREQQKKE